MWNPFKRKQHQPETKSPRNRVDDLAEELHKEKRLVELESRLHDLSPATLTSKELESWHRHYGIAAFNRGDHKTAFQRFDVGLKACPESHFLRFSLGQECEHFGMTERMFELFDQTQFPEIPPAFLMAEARYAYLWSRPDKGESYLKPLLGAYYKLGIADDHFLFMRGFPFFGETWAYLGLCFVLQDKFDAWRVLTEEAAQRLSEFDFDAMRRQLKCVETNDFKTIITELEPRIQEWKPKGFATGYNEMLVAVLDSQSCADASEAESRLKSVSLGVNDFKWLEDIRLLARCELAHRNRNEKAEAELRTEFFSKQPLLFEPSHALNFNLWRYQEKLKSFYQNAKKANIQRP